MSELKRNCPDCGCEIVYKSKDAYRTGNKNGSSCRKCTSIKTGFTGKFATKGKGCGEDNPFYGKHHTEESKAKIVENKDYSSYRTPEFREKISKLSSGKNNGMYGISFYDKWVLDYGKEEADKREKIRREKLKEAFSGEKNPMYGKPTPKKAGNGWSGWYKDWFFRSLRELSYMINNIEKNGDMWESCEGLFRITYVDWDGKMRTYSPDFFVNNKVVVEIKPIRLHSSSTVLSKQQAGENFCKENGYEYLLTDVKILDISDLDEKINSGLVVFTDKTKEKYAKYKEAHPDAWDTLFGQIFSG